jgi:hypothetical protein
MNFSLKGYFAICCLSVGTGVTAYGQRPTEVVKWSVDTQKTTANSASVVLSATVEDGWHVYALSQPPGGPTPLKISVPSGSPMSLSGPIVESTVTRHFDQTFNTETVYYLKSAKFTLNLQGTGAASAEAVPIDIRFQACSDRLCLPPYTAHLNATLKKK